MLLSRRSTKESGVLGPSALTDFDVRQLFNVLPVSAAARLEGRSDCGEIALQAVRRVVGRNSEAKAVVP